MPRVVPGPSSTLKEPRHAISSSQELPCAARATGSLQGAPANSQRSGSRHSRDPDRNNAAPDGGEGAAGACEELRLPSAPGPAQAGPPPPAERKKSLRRKGPGRGRARQSAGSTRSLLAVAAVHPSSTANSNVRLCGSKRSCAQPRLGQ